MSIIEYLASSLEGITPFAHQDCYPYNRPYCRIKESNIEECPAEDSMRIFDLTLESLSHAGMALPEHGLCFQGELLVEVAFPCGLGGTLLERYFENEVGQIVETFCGKDHSTAGIRTIRHIGSQHTESQKTPMELFAHRFAINYERQS